MIHGIVPRERLAGEWQGKEESGGGQRAFLSGCAAGSV